MSEWSVFAVDFQGIGEKPPITLLNYVFTRVNVFGTPSHSLWNSFTEKLFSEARYNNFAFFIDLCSNNLLKNVCSSLFSSNLHPWSYNGRLSWTVRSFKSSFFFTDFRKVFFGLSYSVLTLEAFKPGY
jgi:hypothetical protein